MSAMTPGTPRLRRSRRAQRGQSLAEFGLVAPLVIVLFLTVADFGRIFSTLVILEAAARDGAEAAANAYLAKPPAAGALSTAAPTPGDTTYYAGIHTAAVALSCSESRDLPNTQFTGGECQGMPFFRVCVHDGADPSCGVAPVTSEGAVPADCTAITNPPTNDQGGSAQRWVEVRLCYKFSLILPIPFNPFRDIWLQKTRMFGISCYFATGTTNECGV